MKKTLSVLLTLVLALGMLFAVMATAQAGYTMYNASSNGKSVNVREYPSTDAPRLGNVPYGGAVSVRISMGSGWSCIDWNGGVGYVMSRFLSDVRPAPKPAPTPEEKDKQTEQAKLKKEQASERTVAEPFYIAVVPTRTTGRINFRSAPSKTTRRVASFGDGKELIVMGETDNWYYARDPETDKTGYIFKNYTVRLNKALDVGTKTDGKERIGALTVNGQFDVTCKLPETYTMQVINIRGQSLTAAILSDDITKPTLNLSIAYDDTYSDVGRLNDLTEEELKVLESTFTELDTVDISYAQTGFGTKLLIARENNGDGLTEYVEILTIYKGYFIEFDMEPSEYAAQKNLTDEQIQMCIDFLTNVDFNEIK